jgi:hypothetical protein
VYLLRKGSLENESFRVLMNVELVGLKEGFDFMVLKSRYWQAVMLNRYNSKPDS